MGVRVPPPPSTLDARTKNCRTQGEKKVCKAHLCFLNFVLLPRGIIELGRLVPNRAIFGVEYCTISMLIANGKQKIWYTNRNYGEMEVSLWMV